VYSCAIKHTLVLLGILLCYQAYSHANELSSILSFHPFRLLPCYHVYSHSSKRTLKLLSILSYHQVYSHPMLPNIFSCYQAYVPAIKHTLPPSSILSCYQAYSHAIEHTLLLLSILSCNRVHSCAIKHTLVLSGILLCYQALSHANELSSLLAFYPSIISSNAAKHILML
jgi:hypothetical protein